MVNSEKIKDRMKNLGITQRELANDLGLAQATTCQKINNVRSFTLEEAEKVAKKLCIDNESFAQYFFS